VFSGPSFDDFDFDICCQGHDSELDLQKILVVARYLLKSY